MTTTYTEAERVAAIAHYGFDRPEDDDTYVGFPSMPIPLGGMTTNEYRKALVAWAAEFDRAAALLARSVMRSTAPQPSIAQSPTDVPKEAHE